MSSTEFLKNALPPGTRYALRIIKKPDARNIIYTSIDELVEDAVQYSAAGWNVYYATVGLGAADNAKAENAVAKKEFYIDVDCGPDKPFKTKGDGMQALRQFCLDVHLPRPTIIDSGNGVHAHWLFAQAVPVHEWKEAAESLKALCASKNFYVDSDCTADIVRVLRIPDTVNTKGNHTVKQLTGNKLHLFEDLREIINASLPQDANLFKKARALTQSAGGVSEVAKLIASNKTSKFETIWVKSVKGEGCAQIKHAIENADSLSEPIWRASLSIAQYCEDRDWAIHELSKDHPGYDAQETEQKAALIKGPYTCETFQGSDTASLCAGCPHAGKITSPIQLGAEFKEAAPEDNKVTVGKQEFEIPSYPNPFFRGAHGGIYMYVKTQDDEGGRRGEMIYPHDLYAYKRMRDPQLGDVVWLRHHMPNNDTRDFCLPQSCIGALDKLREGVSKEGVTIFHNKHLQSLQLFLALQIQELQFKEKANDMRTRFGWTQENTFVIGNREYTRDGVRFTPIAKSLEDLVRHLTPKGTPEAWKSVIAQYENEAFDMHAFGVLCGFGSVLMKLSPESGGVVNFYSKKSGTGKTTILRAANSIFGDPMGLMKDARDTQLTKVHRMGVMNGMINTLDEMTNTHPEEVSNLLYGCTQGRGRDRMQSNANAERHNSITWDAASLWSGNTSIEDCLSLIKVDPQGELARVIEIHLLTPVPSDVLETQKIFNSLNDNYGHAGDVFMRYVIPHLEEVTQIWEKTRDKIYSMHTWTQTERYKLNVVICAMAAGVITNALGLTNFNLGRITKKIADRVQSAAEDLRNNSVKATETIAAFVNKNLRNMLVINGITKSTLKEKEFRAPMGELVLRYEPDTASLFISLRDFKKWCATSFINGSEIRGQFKSETGQELIVTKKRLGAGWDTDFGSVSVYEIKNATNVLGIQIKDTEDDAVPVQSEN